ncbi:MAG: LysM peptidoglycan-binding domain-containing protein [Bacteroidales bacterium]|jgi:membrane-bound lytic murein transglycosylase D
MKIFRLFFVLFLFLSLLTCAFAQDTRSKSDTSKTPINDDPILEMLDSLSASRFLQCSDFTTDINVLNKHNFAPDYTPSYTDEEYKERIAKLNAVSPFPYVYNKCVKDYIQVYTVKKRQLVSRMLGLAQLYFPLFEETLDKYKLPLELKYLAIVESALNPFAISRCGATGLWQFMYNTSKLYNLEVNSYIDERYDVYKETLAACEYLQDLYNMYGDWALVLAAYNSGPSNVNKAIRRARGAISFWDIKRFLPRETQGYVPAFIAVSYVMNYASEHNIYPLEPRITYHQLDTIKVNHTVTFEQISAILKIPQEDLKFLNPVYKKGIIPYIDESQSIILPYELIGDFIKNAELIYSYASPVENEKQKQLLAKLNIPYIEKSTKQDTISISHTLADSNSTAKNNAQKISTNQYKADEVIENKNNKSTGENKQKQYNQEYYIVKRGEGLGTICNKFNCSINDLMQWNKLSSKTIHPGQKLIVHEIQKDTSLEKNNSAQKIEVSKTIQKPIKNTPNKKIIYYTVQKGDTLWSIASLYKGVTVDEIKRLNKIYNTRQLKPGTKLKIVL